MASVTLNIKGMTCGHCRMAVTNALKNVAGVTGAEVNLEQGLATVTYESPANVDQLKAAVEEEGYEVVGAREG